MRRALKQRRLHYRVIAALAAALLAGCGNSVEKAFSNCVAASEKQSLANNKGVLPPDLAKMYAQASRSVAEKQCGIIRDECRSNPQADLCQRLIRQYGNH